MVSVVVGHGLASLYMSIMSRISFVPWTFLRILCYMDYTIFHIIPLSYEVESWRTSSVGGSPVSLCHECPLLYGLHIPLFMWMTPLSSSYHCIVLSFSCLIVVLCHASCGTCRPVMMLVSGGKQSSKETWANVSQCCSLMGYGLRPQTCFGWRACWKGVSEGEDMQQAKKQVKQLALRPCRTRPYCLSASDPPRWTSGPSGALMGQHQPK
jgi:hypothetical protein